jgi:tetratricopeptide (TPR) repeat protein
MVNGNSENIPEMKPNGEFSGNLPQAETNLDNGRRETGGEFEFVRPPSPFFSISQKIIIALIIFVAGLLVYFLLKYSRGSASDLTSHSYKQSPAAVLRQGSKPQPPQTPLPQTESAEKNEQPISLQTAQSLEKQKDYQQAFDSYSWLRQNLLQTGEDSRLLADFLQFKMALCQQRMSRQEEADRIFKTLANSSSPAIRCFAAYNSIGSQIKNKQYLAALANTYRCLGSLELLGLERESAAALTRNCHFLAAQCLTQNILMLSGENGKLPEQLWISQTQIDPFVNLDEAQIISLLGSGSEILNRALLAPQIQPAGGGPVRWQVACYRASVEELLSRFATAAGLELKWNFAAGGSSEQANVRRRIVTLYLPGATERQVAAVAAGCAGLLASVDDNGTITVYNPEDISVLSEQLSVCSEQAVSLWHQFLLRFDQDASAGNVHFAIGLLYAQMQDIPKAISEFKLVANRFTHSAIVPFALLNSSRLKTNIKDYSGAREDLLQLVEQYPDAAVGDEAVFYLADATFAASLFGEARPLYEKLYNLNLSLRSQAAASFGLGCCLFEEKKYEESIKWLTRYLNLTKEKPDENLYRAYLLMGRAYLGLDKADEACTAFQYALAGRPAGGGPEEYIEITSALVDSFVVRERFVEALGVLDSVELWRLSQKENVKVVLLKAEVLRRIGLVDKAVSVIGDRADYVSDVQLKARILFELAQCYKADGRLELARRNLSDILVIAEKGLLFDSAAIELADVCKKLGRNSEAISVCVQLLNSQPQDDVKKQALSILAYVYRSQKDYDNALLALMGKWKNDNQ